MVSGGGHALRRGKDVLERLQADADGTKNTCETFIKTILSHYKVAMDVVAVKELLHTRARMYYRVGKLLQMGDNTAFSVSHCRATYVRTYVRTCIRLRSFACT